MRFPLRISYPANRPYAGSTIEKAGSRVIITYESAKELKECLELHKLAWQMEREITPGGVLEIKIEQNSF